MKLAYIQFASLIGGAIDEEVNVKMARVEWNSSQRQLINGLPPLSQRICETFPSLRSLSVFVSFDSHTWHWLWIINLIIYLNMVGHANSRSSHSLSPSISLSVQSFFLLLLFFFCCSNSFPFFPLHFAFEYFKMLTDNDNINGTMDLDKLWRTHFFDSIPSHSMSTFSSRVVART